MDIKTVEQAVALIKQRKGDVTIRTSARATYKTKDNRQIPCFRIALVMGRDFAIWIVQPNGASFEFEDFRKRYQIADKFSMEERAALLQSQQPRQPK